MNAIIRKLPVLTVWLLVTAPAGAVSLTGGDFSSDGSTSSAVSGQSSSSNFKSVNSGGEGSADGEVEGISFKNQPGFAELVDLLCPDPDDGDPDYTTHSRVGDPCDLDDDDDDVPDEHDEVTGLGPDNCPMTANQNQDDFESDGIGDECDLDDDGDLVADTSDNCLLLYNPSQLNTDGDSEGNACDPDDDNDGLPDIVEEDDSDGATTDPLVADSDGDGVLDGDEDANQNGEVDLDEDGNPIETNPNDSDSDGDTLTDGQEVDNGLDPLDPDDAQEDPDLDTLVSADEINAGLDPLDPDSDGDDMQDNIDAKPGEANNICTGLEATLSTLAVTQEVTCAARTSISVTGGLNGVEVLSNGELILLSPDVSFEDGFKVETGGTLSLQTIDPCPVCDP